MPGIVERMGHPTRISIDRKEIIGWVVVKSHGKMTTWWSVCVPEKNQTLETESVLFHLKLFLF